MKKCPDCQHVIQSWQSYCPHCSADLLKRREVQQSRKKKKLLSF